MHTVIVFPLSGVSQQKWRCERRQGGQPGESVCWQIQMRPQKQIREELRVADLLTAQVQFLHRGVTDWSRS